MTDRVTVVRVFIASPGDVGEEREVFDEVLEDLNRLVGEERGLLLRPVKFETHARPGIGIDAQDVINRQLPDYDIFVGLLWQRFGTPTGRASSGTEEEFDRALERYRAVPQQLRIMFYFKSAPVDPTKIDLIQLQRVRDFRAKLEALGVLYWHIATADDFRIQLRTHLAGELREFGTSWGVKEEEELREELPSPAKATLDISDDDDTPGLVELILDVQDSATTGTERIEALTKKQTRLTERLNRLHDEFRGVDMGTRAGIVQAKRALERTATAMLTFAHELEKEMPQICDSAIKMAESMSKAVVLGGPGMVREEQRISVTSTLTSTGEGITNFRVLMAGLRESIPPQMGLISAPMRTAVGSLKRALSQSEQLLDQARTAIDAAVASMNPST